MKDITYFFTQIYFNIKNAHALAKSFWIGVSGMVINNTAFFIMWYLFMKATGDINGWSSTDVMGMLGISMLTFGVVHSFFFGIVKMSDFVNEGKFDSVLLSPVSTFVRQSGMQFSVVAYGDLLQGIAVTIWYILHIHLSFIDVGILLFGIILGSIVFVALVLVISSISFYVQDSAIIADQLRDILIRPSLYPGGIFPEGLKIFFMTVVPALLTSSVPIDMVKDPSLQMFTIPTVAVLVWVLLARYIFSRALRRYESGNMLRS